MDGWDPESGAVVGYINVIVNSITDGDNVDKTEGSGKTDPTENADPTETPETSSEKPAADENADTDNKEDKEIPQSLLHIYCITNLLIGTCLNFIQSVFM